MKYSLVLTPSKRQGAKGNTGYAINHFWTFFALCAIVLMTISLQQPSSWALQLQTGITTVSLDQVLNTFVVEF